MLWSSWTRRLSLRFLKPFAHLQIMSVFVQIGPMFLSLAAEMCCLSKTFPKRAEAFLCARRAGMTPWNSLVARREELPRLARRVLPWVVGGSAVYL